MKTTQAKNSARSATRASRASKPAAGIQIKVTPADKKRLEALAEKSGVPLGAAANAAIAAADHLIRGQEIAQKVTGGPGGTYFLWMCINRDKALFTESVPLSRDGYGYFQQAEEDAKQLGRTMADWCGSLINIGLEALSELPARAMMASRLESVDYFVKARAFDTLVKGGAA